MKHPPVQYTDSVALGMLEEFIAGRDVGTYEPAPNAVRAPAK
jgi:hypothetical protein